MRSTRNILVGTAVLCATVPALATESARVRVIHASPDAPAVDVRVNGGVAFGDLAFGGITEYAELAPDTYNVTVSPAGVKVPIVIDADLTLDPGLDYSVLAINTLDQIEPLVLVDDNTLDPEQARVRFVHASPNAPAVDIAIADGGPVLFPDAEFRDATAYLPVAPGEYDLEVRLAGTDTVVLDLPDLDFTQGRVYTAVATGLVGGTPMLQALLSADASGPFDISVVHASPDAPAVDVLVNGGAAFTNIPFTGDAGPASLPADTYNIQVVPTGLTEPVVIDADVAFDPFESYTVVAVGELAEIAPLVLVNDLELDPNNARVRFVHASPDAPAVDIAVAGGGPVLFSNVSFTEDSGPIPVPAGTYDLEVRVAGTDTVVLTVPGVGLDVNTAVTVYAMGLAGGEPALQAVLKIDAAGTSRVRAIHLSPDAPNVDVLVNDAAAIVDLPFTGVSDYATLDSDTTNFKVVPSGATEPVVIEADLDLAPMTDYSILAIDTLSQITPLVLVDDNTLDAANGRVRFVHASPDAPAVDIAVAAGGPVLFSNVSFGEFAAAIPVAPGTYDLEVLVAGTDVVALELPGITVRPNTVVTAYASGLLNGQPALGAVLSLDAQGCIGDIDADGAVDFFDLIHVLSAWNTSGSGSDLDGSGTVDFFDLLTLLSNWGDC